MRETAHALEESKRIGYENLGEIARNLSERMEIPIGYALRHLKNLNHNFTEDNRGSLTKYYEYAREIGMISEVPEIETIEI
ncbi:MAG: hypothetical protein SV377_06285 [Halobacteria archaeon]|nr:hypothetical protein [Halobacteria archaeon]